jgi:hypothetical protein
MDLREERPHSLVESDHKFISKEGLQEERYKDISSSVF